jgi:hypothetical protein
MGVVVGEVVRDAGDPAVHVAAAERLGVDLLAGRGLHQRRSAEEDRALVAHDDGLVAHRGNVGAAGRAGTHHHGDLRDVGGRHAGLVVEDPAEVIAVREHLVLQRQEGAARIHQVDARQVVLERHLLRAQVLLHGEREIRAALDGRVVGDHHDFPAGDAADPGDDPGGGRLVLVQPVRRERRQLQERAARIEQGVHPLAGQQLAALRVQGPRPLPAAEGDALQLRLEILDQRFHVAAVRDEGLAGVLDGGGQRSASAQIASMATAVASPPPMHREATPRFRPRARNACASVTRRRAPVAPMGWPSAQAPPFTLTRWRIEAEVVDRGHRHDGKGLVDLVQVDVVRLPAEPVEQVLHGRYRRRGEPLGRMREAAVADDPRQRLEAAPRWASDSVIRTRAAAPSEIDEDEAAVTVPSLLNAGRMVGTLSISQRPGSSSFAHRPARRAASSPSRE